MTWLGAVPDLLACVGLFFAPGLLAAYLGGLRGISAWAVAPLVTVAVVAAVALAGGWFGFRFGLWPVAAGIVVMACITAGLSLLIGARQVERPSDPRSYTLTVVIGAVAAAVIGGVTFITGVKRPDAINEGWDAVFHYNAVRFIEQSGKASPLTIGTLDQPGTHGGFYPDAWHAMAALLAELTGAAIPVAATVTSLVVAVLVWPLGCLLLARHLFGAAGGRATAAVIITGMLSTLFSAFPWMLVGPWGPVWPNALGIAMAPAGVALGMSITRASEGDTFGAQRWFFGPIGAFAIAIAHPNAALSVAVVCLFPLLVVLGPPVAGHYRRHPLGTTLVLLAVVAMVALGGLAAYSLPELRMVTAQVYPTIESPGQAAMDALINATTGLPAELVFAEFSLIGAIACFGWRRWRWLVGVELVFVALYVGCASMGSHFSRLVTGPWYSDTNRIAATLPVIAIPLTTMGVLAAGEGLHQLLRRVVFRAAVGRAAAFGGPLALGIAITAVTAMRFVPANAVLVGEQFNDGRLVGQQKLQALEAVARLVPASALVADNPFDGTALMPALSGTRVLFPQIPAAGYSQDTAYLAGHLVQLGQNERICDLVRRYSVAYMVTAPDNFWLGHGNPGLYSGVADPDGKPGFRLVAEDGPVRLYKITSCQPSYHSAGPIDAAIRGST